MGSLRVELGTAWVNSWMRAAAADLHEQRGMLIDLDRAIGDGDHGDNMDRGFTAVVDRLDDNDSPAEALKRVATTLISVVGGASGPLYGTAFLRASTAIAGLTTLDDAAVVALLTGARDGIVARGKAGLGDKTMLDAWIPAVEAAEHALSTGAEPLVAAADAADAGASSTDALVARKGRASYLGERAVGHRDPGAASTAILLRAAQRTAS
jgi:dihydroxyacetone kinase-like protein